MNIKNIVIASPMHEQIRRVIEKEELSYQFRYCSDDEVTQHDVNWADAFVSFNMKNDFDYGQLKWVHSLGAGVDRFLYRREWPENVLLTRTICSFGQRIGEYCLSYLLKDLQEHNRFHSLKKQKSWQPYTPGLLSEQRVMVFGTGEIGQKTAEILSSLGVEVHGVSLSGKQKRFFEEVVKVESCHARLSEMDYVINTLPLTEQTEGLFNEHIFNKLNRAGFINVGRGATVDEKALLHALNQHYVRFAVLDVFKEEPLPETHEFWEHPGIFITPHISAVTTPEEGAECFIDTLKNLENNQPLPNKVDVHKGF
ncbi:D-2-hydroxyacid dehydrogenase [Bacillus thermotolerans]|uniref:D-3-phosphoglycerate dehydrogenase n=1 Tax=Bacillus thermotolerans TaxID=1221996 RepID=A0A0F5I504_BACTR|nr:D-2-hydroxyacid dehydrogenase [Bacillus thermotolerans]KKB38082.1 D-3-phosphoglycerate dehydrogenase [Bacillus thermotolerans]KKB40744.1 D-3-phosphoglycerate dehydrogenase [Bacillus thermotolerans]KKB41668.1 D-3-phosphoglycerate dehydrogenase [Bacillus thermotolerans]